MSKKQDEKRTFVKHYKVKCLAKQNRKGEKTLVQTEVVENFPISHSRMDVEKWTKAANSQTKIGDSVFVWFEKKDVKKSLFEEIEEGIETEEQGEIDLSK